MKILIVEDSSVLRRSMKQLIEKIGHSTLFANSGEEALQMVGVSDFDLVIMDVEMPGLDGFETTSLMREALDGRWIPIVFVTSNTSDESVVAGIEAGADDYLIKPLSKGLLEAKLKAMHRIAEMQRQLSRLNSELAILSQRDGLTQLFNRHTFIDRATQSLVESWRHTKPCALLMLDVDFFKQYNDSYGHVRGDDCLQQVAQAIESTTKRESDIVGRYGGEEFVVMLLQTDRDGAILVAEKILRAVEDLNIAHESSAVSDSVTISIGINVMESCTQPTLDRLILAADKNLYRAKSQGRNCLVVDDSRLRTILIVDSDGARLNALTEILQPLGNIITSDDHQESLDLAKEIMPDVILLNSECPQLKGRQLEATLREHVRTARTPVLFITSEAGAVEYSIDPIRQTAEAVREKVVKILEG